MIARDDIGASIPEAVRSVDRRPAGATLLSVGGILGALAAASCCVVPFALFMLGVSGAWISNLTALAPYQPIFATVTLGFLGGGFYRSEEHTSELQSRV